MATDLGHRLNADRFNTGAGCLGSILEAGYAADGVVDLAPRTATRGADASQAGPSRTAPLKESPSSLMPVPVIQRLVLTALKVAWVSSWRRERFLL